MPYRDNRTREVHRFICRFAYEKGFTPTLNEIAEHEGFKSNGGVLRHLDKLERWGWIERHHGHARTIHILKMCNDCLIQISEDIPCPSPPLSRQR